MTSPDILSTWPTLEEASKQSGISERTLYRNRAEGKLEIQKRPKEGSKPENVVNPDDLAQLTIAQPRIMPREETGQIVPSRHPDNVGIASIVPLTVKMAESVMQQNDTEAELLEIERERSLREQHESRQRYLAGKAWLSLDEAEEYISLPRSEILRLIRAEKLVARKVGRWFIQRASLDKDAGLR